MAQANDSNRVLKGFITATVFIPLITGSIWWIYHVGTQTQNLSDRINQVDEFCRTMKNEGTLVSQGGRVERAAIQMQISNMDAKLADLSDDIRNTQKEQAERTDKILKALEKLTERE